MNEPLKNASEEELEKTIVVGATKKLSTIPIPFPKKESAASLQERYKIIKILGSDPIESTKLALDHFLRREVLLKTFRKPPSPSKAQSARFRQFVNEAKTTALLEHPNILPLYDKQELPESLFYFTLRKIEGQTLQQMIHKTQQGEEKYDSNKLLTVFLKVCDAISYAHSQGFVHQNLSAEDIYVGAYGEVYVTYWGFSDQVGKINEEQNQWFQENTGSLLHIAPEQRESGNRTKTHSDIYALGVLLNSCFVQPPADIEAIITKALQPQWSKRYASVQEMIIDLENYSKHLRVSVREYTLFDLLSKWMARNRKGIFATLFALVIVGVVFSFVFFKSHQENKKQLESEYNQYFEQAKKGQQRCKESIGNETKREEAIKDFFLTRDSLKKALQYTKYFPESAEQKSQNLYETTGINLIEITSDSTAYDLAEEIIKLFKGTIKESATRVKEEKKEIAKITQQETKNKILKQWETIEEKIKKAFLPPEREELLILKISAVLEKDRVLFKKVQEQLKQLDREKFQNHEIFYERLAKSLANTRKNEAKMLLISKLNHLQKYLESTLPEERLLSEEQLHDTLTNVLKLNFGISFPESNK